MDGIVGANAPMDRAGLADFLRRRRELLQPEDVGLPRGSRRRATGLRREEVAALADMSTDYYSRIERRRGPQPSEEILAALARGLRLTLDERDHLFLLAGHSAPRRVARVDHVTPGMMRVFDRLDDTPAQVVSDLGETLLQNRLAKALLGDETCHAGMARSVVYRWYTDPAARRLYPREDHEQHGRALTAQLHSAVARQGPGSRAAALADALTERSSEFAAHWRDHRVGLSLTNQTKRLRHPEVGPLELYCQILLDPEQSQSLLIYTAAPGSDTHERLELLRVIGDQGFEPGTPPPADPGRTETP